MIYQFLLNSRLLRAPTLTRNARSPAMFLSVDEFLPVLSRRWRCKGPSSSAVITFTTLRSTTVLRRDIVTCPCTCHRVSGNLYMVNVSVLHRSCIYFFNTGMLPSTMLLPLVNAGPWPRQFVSTCWRSTRLLEPRNPLRSFKTIVFWKVISNTEKKTRAALII